MGKCLALSDLNAGFCQRAGRCLVVARDVSFKRCDGTEATSKASRFTVYIPDPG
jgi:hypothetical protein